MKVFFQGLLVVLAVETLHFLLLTGALCGLVFFTLSTDETSVTFERRERYNSLLG